MSAVLSPAEFEYLRTLVKTEAGIDLGPDKHYLVDSRLRSLAISHGFSDPWALLKAMKATPSPNPVALFGSGQRPVPQARSPIPSP